jgi:hypothetical protein
VQLQPRRPPGRSDRKAAAYASEIVRLRAEGYTFEAIREALAAVGIELSESALRREVRRHQKRSVRAAPDVRSPPQALHASAVVAAVPVPQGSTAKPQPTVTTGREIAEAFFNAHPSNPLFPTQETP